jgi:hypothetical protein
MDGMGLVERAERALSIYYEKEDDLKRLFDNARVVVDSVDLTGGGVPKLNAGLRYAYKLNKLDSVIEAALRDHKDDLDLQELRDKLGIGVPSRITALVASLSGFLVPLRQSRHLAHDEIEKFDAILQQIFDLTAIGRSSLPDDGVDSSHWPELQQALRNCLQHFQLYRELLEASARTPRWRVPGAPEARVPLSEMAADRMALIDAKLHVYDAVSEVVKARNVAD